MEGTFGMPRVSHVYAVIVQSSTGTTILHSLITAKSLSDYETLGEVITQRVE